MFSPNNFMSPFINLNTSLWPFLISVDLLCVAVSFVLWVNNNINPTVCALLTILTLMLMLLWWRDVVRESIVGYHTANLEFSFRFGIMWFIVSEGFFFVSFFWAFYDSSLAPTVDIGLAWPPLGILPLSVYSVPLLNTVILLSSGVTVTWAHHALMCNLFSSSIYSLSATVGLGLYFLLMQYEEYSESAFAISDGIYGSTFFISTGFHGVHVIVGTSILFYSLVHIAFAKLTCLHHFMFEASAWYWHFVDVVWLFLFISIYWWGSI